MLNFMCSALKFESRPGRNSMHFGSSSRDKFVLCEDIHAFPRLESKRYSDTSDQLMYPTETCENVCDMNATASHPDDVVI